MFLITGGAGFIGYHQAKRLLEMGRTVRVLDDLSTGSRQNLVKGVEFVHGSVNDEDACNAALEGCIGVIHLASSARRYSVGTPFPELHERVHVQGTGTLLRACLRQDIRCFVYASSYLCYGPAAPPQSVSDAARPSTPFALSVYRGELLVEAAAQRGLPCRVLRYFSVYGLRQPVIGAYAVGAATRAMSGDTITIGGSADQRRDLIHVRDVVEANNAAVDSAFRQPREFYTLNIGTGRSVLVRKLINDRGARARFCSGLGEPLETRAGLNQTFSVLGWRPRRFAF